MCKVKFLIYLIWKLNKVQIAKTEKKEKKRKDANDVCKNKFVNLLQNFHIMYTIDRYV